MESGTAAPAPGEEDNTAMTSNGYPSDLSLFPADLTLSSSPIDLLARTLGLQARDCASMAGNQDNDTQDPDELSDDSCSGRYIVLFEGNFVYFAKRLHGKQQLPDTRDRVVFFNCGIEFVWG